MRTKGSNYIVGEGDFEKLEGTLKGQMRYNCVQQSKREILTVHRSGWRCLLVQKL